MLKDLTCIANAEGKRVTEGLTSHATRHGGATLLKMAEEVKEIDISRRGAWAVNSLQPMNNYMHYTSLSDALVARILSEWEGPYRRFGGKCLTFENIHENLNELREYSLRLFGPYLSENLREVLTLSLLIHYNEVKSRYPSHRIISLMENYAVNPSALSEWSTTCLCKYRQLNKLSLDNDAVPQNTVLPSYFDPLVQGQQQLLIRVDHQDKRMDDLEKSMRLLLEGQAVMNTRLEAIISGIPSPSSTSLPVLQPASHTSLTTTTPAMFLPRRTNLHSILPVPNKLEIGKLFELWYVQELYRCTGLSNKNQELFESYIMLISFSKCLLPANTVISPKPSSSSDLATWETAIHDYSKLVNDKWIELRKAYEQKCNEIKTAPVWTIKKLIPTIYRKDKEVFNFGSVRDNATPPDFQYEKKRHRNMRFTNSP